MKPFRVFSSLLVELVVIPLEVWIQIIDQDKIVSKTCLGNCYPVMDC